MSFFRLKSLSDKARTGTISTAHGSIPTPAFMPVATRGCVRGLGQGDLEEMGAQVVLANAYHLELRPGSEIVETANGLHSFMGWKGPILTDSGGYQVFSLRKGATTTPEGVSFPSPYDGRSYFLGPRESMTIQRALGSDIVMAFDHCPPLPSSGEKLRESVDLTLKWAKVCRDFPLKENQHLFGIVQGGLNLDLRRQCLKALEEMDFSGLSLGGLSVGEKTSEMDHFLATFVPEMPENKPRYLMGVGTPTDILKAVSAGIDLFDCVLPTRSGRHGHFFTAQGPFNIKNERFKEDDSPPDIHCSCKICARYSRRYLRHLFMVGEALGPRAASYHNLWFYLRLMEDMGRAIGENRFSSFRNNFEARYSYH